ncbi:MAG: hypothetical protein HFJ52_08850 [Clostridia bacterium]|nr:hypothetical protein [Clostridia bacterium]
MQRKINKYFKKLCKDKFFKNDDEVIIGKAKNVIENLEDQIKYVNNPKNDVDEETIEFITEEAKGLIEEIKKEYPNNNDVIKIAGLPMSGFYILKDRESLFEELKDYYDESEEKNNEN